MSHSRLLLPIPLALAVALGGACCSGPDNSEHDRARGEHSREEGGEHEGREHDERGEESGTELGLGERYDRVRNGARLILAWDATTRSFRGTVENVSGETLRDVRVEVHLSTGVELGPTAAADLGPGEVRAITLEAGGGAFDGWNAHAEVGRGD